MNPRFDGEKNEDFKHKMETFDFLKEQDEGNQVQEEGVEENKEVELYPVREDFEEDLHKFSLLLMSEDKEQRQLRKGYFKEPQSETDFVRMRRKNRKGDIYYNVKGLLL